MIRQNETLHYRARFEVNPSRRGQRVLAQVIDAIWKWVVDKEDRREGQTLAAQLAKAADRRAFVAGGLAAQAGGTGLYAGPRLLTRASDRSDGATFWAMDYDEPDSKYVSRRWHTRIGLSARTGGPCTLNIVVGHCPPPDYIGEYPPEPGANVPNIVKWLLDTPDLRLSVGDTPLLTEELYLDAQTFPDFQESLLSESRELPLILMARSATGAVPVEDVGQLASMLRGVANVYVADWDDEALKARPDELFRWDTPARNYRCEHGYVRVYRPHVDLTDGSGSRRHPFFSHASIEKMQRAVEDPERDAFADALIRGLCRSVRRRSDEVVDLEDIDRLSAGDQRTDLRGQIERMRADRDAAREAARKARSELEEQADGRAQADAAAARSLADLQADHDFWRDMAESLERDNRQLEEDLEVCLQFAGLTDDDQMLVLAQADELQSEIERLSEENELLSLELSERDYRLDRTERRAEADAAADADAQRVARVVEQLDHMPSNLEELLTFAEQLWPSRIVVLDEARASARDFAGGDLDEEWRIIRSAACVLHDICFGEEAREGTVERAFQDRTGFELTFCEGGATNDQPDLVRSRLRWYRGEQVSVVPHIKGRHGYFRLHFHLDHGNKLIVIGHAGAHLTTAGTRRRK